MKVGVPQAIEVRALGALDARLAGRPVTIAGSKPRAILTLLALHAGRAVPEDVVREVLWGEDAPRTAHKAVQTHISMLRGALGPSSVVTEGAGWRLNAGRIDTATFETAYAAARDAQAAGDLRAAADHCGRAAVLWRGRPELPPTPRGAGEVTRWSELYESVVDARIDALLARGQSAELVGELEGAVTRTPLRERRWAQLCIALYRNGRQGDALKTYQRARDLLRRELGVEPGPELRAVEAAVLAHDPALGPARADPSDVRSPAPDTGGQTDDPDRQPSTGHGSLPNTGPGRLPISRTAFVGRTAELARLQRLLAEHALVTVTGPGGVGKTRLAVVAAEAAAGFPGGVVFIDLVPATSELVGQAVAAALGVTDRTGRAPEEFIADRLAGQRILLVLDNCEHVIDSAGELAGRLIQRTDVTILATSRERLGARGEAVLVLPPLSLASPGSGPAHGSEAAELFLDRIQASSGGTPADPELIGQICARLDGVPLAIELAAARSVSLGLDGLLSGLDDRLALLSGGRGMDERHRSVRAVLDWSHELLDHAERRLFRRVSVFVGGFDLSAAAAVSHGAAGVSGVIDVIGRLTDKSLLVLERGTAGSRWRMVEVVRSYAGEHLAASGDLAEVQAEHLRWAGVAAAELERKLDAGLPWRDTFDAIADDLRVALFGPADDTGECRPDLALVLARLQARRGRFAAAQAAYEAALALATAAGDPNQLARAALGASTAGMLFGVGQAGRVALLEDALAAQPDKPTSERARLQARLATELFWSPDHRRSVALADEAVATAEQLADDPGSLAHALHARHYVTRGPSGRAEGLDLAERVIELARQAGETQLELAGRAAHVVGLLEAGDLGRMDAELVLLADGADRLDHPEFQWYAAVYRLIRAFSDGRFADADALADQATAAATQAPDFSVGLFFAEAVTDLRPLAGDARTARLARLAEMARRFPNVLVWRCLAVAASAELPTAPDAVLTEVADLVDRLLDDHRDGHWLVACCLVAEAVAAVPSPELAGRLDRALRPYAGRIAVAGRVGAFRGAVSHALGLLALGMGRTDRAIADLEKAVTQHSRLAAHPFHARSLRALADGLHRRNRPGDAERAASARSGAVELSDPQARDAQRG